MIKAWTEFWASRYFFTGGTAAALLLLIFVIFFFLYERKRRQQKSRRSQQFESTFAERLARRNTSQRSSSRIDVGASQANLRSDAGFTSQPNLNSDPEDGRRRPTFSRFLQLWKGLRSSKRKSNSEENRRSVVFTIPTENIFPKGETKQQTQRVCSENPDHMISMDDGFLTHLCDVHKENRDTSNQGNRKEPEKERHVSRNRHGLKAKALAHEYGDMPVATTSDQKSQDDVNHKRMHDLAGNNGQSNEDKLTRESDGESDSGCGSSCHEISGSEPPVTYVALNIKSFQVCQSENKNNLAMINLGKAYSLNFSTNSLPSQMMSGRERCVDDNDKGKHIVDEPRSQRQQLEKTVEEENSFEVLIQLAKKGMSNQARENLEHFDNREGNARNKSVSLAENDKEFVFRDYHESEMILSRGSTDRASTISSNTQTNKHSQEKQLTHSTERGSALCFDTCNVDSGVGISCEDSRLVSTLSTNGVALSVPELDQSEFREGVERKAVQKRQKQVSFGPSPVCSEHSLNNTGEIESVNDTKYRATNSKTLRSIESLTSPNEALCLVNTATDKDEKKDVNKECLATAQDVGKGVDVGMASATNMKTLKLPSFETLQVPAQSSPDHSRIRSFSATMRRKFSFRERQNPRNRKSDSFLAERPASKAKKVMAFRSFRVNKKNKENSDSDSSTRTGEGCEARNHRSMYDEIFSKDTGSPVFTDVPFTIPEIYD